MDRLKQLKQRSETVSVSDTETDTETGSETERWTEVLTCPPETTKERKPMDRKAQIIRLFNLEKPFCLTYKLRSELYKSDYPFLAELLRDGVIEIVEKDKGKVTYLFKGADENRHKD
jgi:hypothetical protein